MCRKTIILSLVIVLVPLLAFATQEFTEELPAERLTDQAKLAIQAAPDWLQDDLTDNMERMQESFQDIYADMIINPSDIRFRDEIAFCVANLGTANLEDPDFVPELLEENVFYIYEHDQYLEYVRIYDVGDPDQDPGYYTTAFYNIEEDGTIIEYELPRDVYYWNIVHPKIEDEQANYIDPDADGDVPAPPPTGVFWRNRLFTYTEEIPETDEDYPILRDAMIGVNAMWGNTTTGAIGVLSNWARSTLEFTSGAERPHQPVRIYTLHKGRCGEWQDYTTAAARACLIPSLNTEAISEDHVWNEFWHLRWIHWEPVNGDGYIDNPLVYENGWGLSLSGVFNVSGDGYIWDVIDRYSEGYCTINAIVVDANGDPVDGARLSVKESGYPGCYGYAGADGLAAVMYGDGITALGKIISEIGKFPAGGATYEIVTETVDAGVYSWVAQYTTETIPVIPWSLKTATETSKYRLKVDHEVTGEVRTGYYPFDKQNQYTRKNIGGSVDVFIVDSANRLLYETGQVFEAYMIQTMSNSGSVEFVLPYFDTWTVIVSTERKLTSEQMVSVHVMLEEDQDGTWTELVSAVRDVSLLPGECYSASVISGGALGVKVAMSTTLLHPGDTCWCYAVVHNPNLQDTGESIPLFVILDVFGEMFFAPEFNEFSNYTIADLQSNEAQTFIVLPEFVWPVISGTVTGLYWYAGMTNPEMTELLGDMDILGFGWTE
ncbi:hypothetical protein K8T06_00595 [bacterium]|nr:hypothetical protein [bacterium]